MRDMWRNMLLEYPGSVEETPFGPEPLVYKVGGKIFAILATGDIPRMSLKCEPFRAKELRTLYGAITPGYHLNKEHWNTVLLDGSVETAMIEELIKHSYELIVAALPKSKRPQ